MADKTFTVSLSDGGSTEKIIKQVLRLVKTIEGAQAAARTPLAVGAAQAGVAAASSASSKAYAKTAPGGAATDTNLSRGVAGQTGASGRDFAAQAQGLGGLVHVYATFAANLFAVSAAWTALSHAMDVSNLAKGLDQVGVASGRAFGTLAKQMVSITGNAISMKEAMTSASLATSGGMTSSGILRMTEIARKASQALGRDMPDAMERLTKGIVKTQPELLDELGIMTRMIPAQQEYARQIGKTISSLSTFEKQQAFANAVLAEGERKFKDIKVETNPYSAMLAGMKNLSLVGLDLINKVLSPIVGFLSSSPAALGTTMALVIAMLLKQAVPALGMIKENMKATAEASRTLANVKLAEARSSAVQIHEINKQAALKDVEIQANAMDDAANRIKAIRGRMGKSLLLDKPAINFEPKDFAKLESIAKGLETKASKATGEQADKLKASAAAYRDYAKEAQLGVNAEVLYNKALADKLKTLDSEKNVTSALYRTKVLANRANSDAMSREITSNAASLASTNGFFAAVKKGYADIKVARATTGKIVVDIPKFDDKGMKVFTEAGNQATESVTLITEKMSRFSGIMTYIKTPIIAATAAVSSMLNFLSPWLMVIGLLVGAYQALDSWLSSASKEIELFGSAMEATTGAAKLLRDVQNDLLNKDSSNWLTAESMTARANAISNSSDALSNLIKKFKDVQKESGWWDSMWDGLAGVFNSSRLQKLGVTVMKNITDGIKVSTNTTANSSFIKEILDISGTKDIGSIKGADLTVSQIDRISAAWEKFSKVASKVAAEISAPKVAFEELDKAWMNLTNAMLPTDHLSKFAMDMVTVGNSLDAATHSAGSLFQELVRLIDTPADLAKLGDVGIKLSKEAPEIKRLAAEYGDVSQAVSMYSETLEKNQSLLKEAQKIGKKPEKYASLSVVGSISEGSSASSNVAALKNTVDSLQKFSNIAKQAQADILKTEVEVENRYKTTGQDLIASGLRLFNSVLNNMVAAANLKFMGAVASSITGLGASEAKTSVGLKELDLRIASNNIMMDLIIAQKANSLSIDRNTTEQAIKNSTALLDVKDPGALVGADRLREEQKLIQLRKTSEILNAASKILVNGKLNTGEYTKAQKGDAAEKAGAAMVSSEYYKIAKNKADNAVIAKEKETLRFNDALAQISEKYVVINRNIQAGIDLKTIDQKRTQDIATLAMSISVQELANAQAISIEKDNSLLLQQEQNKLVEEHNFKLTKTGFLTAAEQKSYNDQNIALGQKKAKLDATNQAAQIARDIADITLKTQKELYDLAGKKQTQDLNNALATSRVDNLKTELEYMKLIGAYEASNYIKQKGSLDLQSLKLANEKTINDTLDVQNQSLIKAAETRNKGLSMVVAGPNAATERAAIEAQYSEAVKRTNEAASVGVQIARSKYEVDSRILAQTTVFNSLIALQQEQMTKMVSVTESLTTAFGDVGVAIGKAGEAILKMAHNEDLYAVKRKALEGAFKEGVKTDIQREKITKEIGKLEEQNTTDKLDSISEIAGSTKKMFAEHTGAYKALAAVEKVTALASLALKAQSMAMTLAELPGTISLAVSKLFAQGGWAGFAGAAAFLALMSSLGARGGSVSAPPAEDQQKVQGTGQYYSGGVLKDTGFGVLGDNTAKSDTLIKGIELIEAHTYETIEYSNKMYEALKAIEKNTELFAANLARIPGFGIKPDTVNRGNFFSGTSKTDVVDMGVIIGGTIGDMLLGKGKVNQYTNTQTESSGGFFDPLNLFGGSSSSNSALNDIPPAFKNKVQQSLGGMFTGIYNAFMASADILKKIPDDVSQALKDVKIDPEIFKTSTMGLHGQDLTDAIQAMVSSAMDDAATIAFPELLHFQKIGEGFGQTVVRVSSDIQDVTASFDLMGMTISTIPDILAKATDAQKQAVTDAQARVDELKKVGTTTSVWQDTTDNGGQYFDVIDKSKVQELVQAEKDLAAARAEVLAATSASTTYMADVVEKLVDMAGGIENFTTRADFFTQTFLSEAERTANISKKLIPAMAELSPAIAELGKSSLAGADGIFNTNEEFKNLVLSLDLSTEKGQNLYTTLMKLAPGFDAVYNTTSKVLNAEDLLAAKRQQVIDLAIVKGDTYNAMLMSRADKEAELLAQDPTGGLVVGQKLIDQAQDVLKAATDMGIAASQISTLFMQGLTSIDPAAGGQYIADTIIYTIKKTMYENAVNQITQTMVDTVITPILLGTMTVGGAAVAMSDALVTAAEIMGRVSKLASDPTWLQFIADMAAGIAAGYQTVINSANLGPAPKQPDSWSVDKTKEDNAAEQRRAQLAQLNIALLTAEGKGYEALMATRAEEIVQLKGDSELIAIKNKVYAAQDAMKTYDLTTQMLEAEGKKKEVLLRTRDKELLNLSKTDRELQKRIWLLQDEKEVMSARRSQASQILALLGDAEGALAITREDELAAMNELIQPMQIYLYALQDEVGIRDKLAGRLKDNISNLKGFIVSLKDAKNELSLGSQSILTPAQKYEQAKSIKDALITASQSTDTSIAGLAARDAAIGKLPAALSSFLDASQVLYASGGQYAQDYNSVQDLYTSLISNFTIQQTDQEKQLDSLHLIQDDTSTIAQLLEEYLMAQTSSNSLLIEGAYHKYAGRGSEPAGKAYWEQQLSSGAVARADFERVFEASAYASDPVSAVKSLIYRSGMSWTTSDAQNQSNLLAIYDKAQQYHFTMKDIVAAVPGISIGQLTDWYGALGIEPFAKGGLAHGLSLVGEQGPEIVNFANPARVYSNSASNDMFNNKELVAEIKNLRAEVALLRKEQHEQTGHLIASNFEANAKAADTIAAATEEAATTSVWAERSKLKLA